MKHALSLAASAAAAALVLTGCTGGSDGSDGSGGDSSKAHGGEKDTVSVKEFCASIDQLDQVDTVAEAKKAFAGLGTPEGMPKDAAAGFDALNEALTKVDDKTKTQDFGQVLVQAMGGSKAQDVQDVQAFATWVGSTCDLSAPSPAPSQ